MIVRDVLNELTNAVRGSKPTRSNVVKLTRQDGAKAHDKCSPKK